MGRSVPSAADVADSAEGATEPPGPVLVWGSPRESAAFSGLKLPQGSKKGVRPGGPGPERPVRGGYFFLPAADLAAAAAFLEASALLALDCFCEDFFWFAFGDLSPMVICRMEVC